MKLMLNIYLLLPTALCILTFIFIVNAIPGMVTDAKLQNFYQCKDHKNTTLLIRNTYVKRISASETRLYGKVVFQDGLQDLKLKLEMYKCASKSEPDTCEYYTAIHVASLCEYFKQKREPWYGYLSSTTMPLKCPVPKGEYDLKGVNIGLTSAFPLINGFWIFKNKGYDTKKKLASCFQMEIIILSHFG